MSNPKQSWQGLATEGTLTELKDGLFGATAQLSSEFTRPADTVAYAQNDMVANSTTSASVVPLTFSNAVISAGGGGIICNIGIETNNLGFASQSFRLWLYNSIPTFTGMADNLAMSLDFTNRSKRIGYVDFTFDPATAGSTSVYAYVSPYLGYDVTTTSIYGLIQLTSTSATPVSGGIISVNLYCIKLS